MPNRITDTVNEALLRDSESYIKKGGTWKQNGVRMCFTKGGWKNQEVSCKYFAVGTVFKVKVKFFDVYNIVQETGHACFHNLISKIAVYIDKFCCHS